MERQPAAAVLVDTDSLDSVTIPLPHLVVEEAPPSRTGARAAPCDLLTVPAAAIVRRGLSNRILDIVRGH